MSPESLKYLSHLFSFDFRTYSVKSSFSPAFSIPLPTSKFYFFTKNRLEYMLVGVGVLLIFTYHWREAGLYELRISLIS